MKDPGTIKRALNTCLIGTKCKDCPYEQEGCATALVQDAVEYIWQLESVIENARGGAR